MTDILRRATHKPPTEVIEGYPTYEWEVVCREALKLKIELPATASVTAISRASEIAAMRASTALSTEPDQPINIAAKTTVALPGLECRPGTADDMNSVEASSAIPESTLAYVEASSEVTLVDRKGPSIVGSTVANALAELLQLARELGADEDHPAVMQAAAILRDGR